MKKFVIVDDAASLVATMAYLIRAQGHEALAIAFNDSGCTRFLNRKEELNLVTQDIRAVAEAIQNFSPDFIFLDHDLRCDGLTGEHVAQAAKIPREKCIGISSTYPQPYCFQKLPGSIKDLDVPIYEDHEHPKFITLLQSLI